MLGRQGTLKMAAMLSGGPRSKHLTAKTRKKGGRRGLGPWPLRCLSQTIFQREKRECLDR